MLCRLHLVVTYKYEKTFFVGFETSVSLSKIKNQKKSKMDKFLVLLLCCVGFVSSIPTNMRRQGRRNQAQSLDTSSDGVRDFLSNDEIVFSNEPETNENDDENDSKKK